MEHAINPHTLDFREELAAIREKFGDRYFAAPAALAELAERRGVSCNDCGVVEALTELIEITHDRFSAEIRLCVTAKGICLASVSFSAPMWGFGSMPSVWNPFGYSDLDAARRCEIDNLIARIRSGGCEPSRAPALAKFLRLLEDAKRPQLSLF